MPVYRYRCASCQAEFEKNQPIAQARQPVECACGSEAMRLLSEVSFLMKGDGWAGKDILVRNQMARKNAMLDTKQEEQKRYWQNAVRLAPNVDGERVDSWQDAKKLAASQGKDTTTYDPLVRKEA